MTDASRPGLMSNTAVHVAFGFLMLGGWAVFANRHHPLPDALLAGLVQGTISGSLTLVLKKFLEWLSARVSPTLRQPRIKSGGDAVGAAPGEGKRQPELVEGGVSRIAALVIPPFVTASAILLILVSAHTLAGTPEVAATIAVPLTVSTTYAIIYNLKLWREAHGRR